MTLNNTYIKYLYPIIPVAFIFFAFHAGGQTSEHVKIKKYKITRLSEYAFNSGNYCAAVDLYLQLFKAEPDKSGISYQLAESYYQLRDYKNAGIWYNKTFCLDSLTFPLVEFKYASMLKMNGNYNDAIAAFTRFYKTCEITNATYYIKQAKKEIKDCKFALAAIENPSSVIITRLDSNVNGINSDFAPLPYEEDKLIFSSLKPSELPDKNNNSPVVKLYYAEKNDSNNFVLKNLFDAPFNKGKMHTANGTFSQDKKKFYFTLCETGSNGKIICNICVSEYKKGSWQEAEKLPESINYPGFSSTHPNYTSNTKKQEVLYFASDRPGGYGGYDIWYIVIKNDNEYAPPKNLGIKINSSGNEITPFYDGNNKLLYFSSDGLKNMGGYDIFSSNGFLLKWEEPVNMGYPVNSSADDFNYILAESDYQNEKEGFFVSNRAGSITNKESGTCCDDIYRFKWQDLSEIADTEKIFAQTSGSILATDTITEEPQKKYFYFDFDKATLRPESEIELNYLATILDKIPDAIIEISGYTDSKGDDEYNLILSQNRANSVVQYLIQNGIDKKRLIAKGYGKINPVAPNTYPDGSDNPEGRQLNRRIEFKIIGELDDSEK